MKKYHLMWPKKLSKNVQVNNFNKFRSNYEYNCFKLLYLFIIIILAGSFCSAMLTDDSRWMNWHFSRLGEGSAFSSMIFNVAIFLSAIVMLALAISLSNNVSKIRSNQNFDAIRAKTIIYRAFTAVTVCLIGVSLFPFDRFPVVHNICGYSMLFVFLALCITAPKFLPIFSKNFYIYSKVVLLCVIICYTLFIVFQTVTLLSIEFVIFIFLYGWLFLFIKGIYRN